MACQNQSGNLSRKIHCYDHGSLQIIHSSFSVLDSNVSMGVAALIPYCQQNFSKVLIVMHFVFKNLESARRLKLLIRGEGRDGETCARIIDKGFNGLGVILDGIVLASRLSMPVRRGG